MLLGGGGGGGILAAVLCVLCAEVGIDTDKSVECTTLI
jgi:hypothetical protein